MPARAKPRKSRSAAGRGSVFFSESKNVWIARLPVGRKLGGGTAYREVWADTQRAAVQKLNDLKPPAPTTTVAEWVERWLRQLTIRPSSLADYRHTADHFIIPTLGKLAVATLTAHQCEEAVKLWMKRLTANTARKNLGHLRSCLDAARRAGLITANPAKDARKPKPRRVLVSVFTPDELRAIIESGRPIFSLLASTGCRIGEALALDVPDFNGREVRIARTYSRKHGSRAPKSDNSARTIRVPDIAIPHLFRARGPRSRGPLFLSLYDARRQHNTVREEWKVLLRDLGLDYRRPHIMRHSVASALVAASVPIPDIARFLGDSPATIIKTYLHPTGSDVTGEIERMLSVPESSKRARFPIVRA